MTANVITGRSFKQFYMRIHLLTGFLGSGKTTAIQHASRVLLRKGIRSGVITNDQGHKLVDGDFFKSQGMPSRQVMNGCFCCNYNELNENIQSLIETNNTEVIFAESVGSCTDIVATVLKPLLRFRPDTQITVSTFTDIRLLRMILTCTTNPFDESINYIYRKQLEEAGSIIVNKIDLVTAEELKEMKQLMAEQYGNIVVLYQNSLDEDCIYKWLLTLDEYPANKMKSLNIDYDIYAEGEAKLAWLDQELEVYAPEGNSLIVIENLINRIHKKITEIQFPIGHLKFLVNGTKKISLTSGTEARASLPIPAITSNETQVGNPATLLVNLRVQSSPAYLAELVRQAIAESETQQNCKIIVISLNSFQPGYPKPINRFETNED